MLRGFNMIALLSADDGGGGQYLLCLESSDVSTVSADLQALGFQSGINPGRMIRVVHTVVRSFATIVRVRRSPTCKSLAPSELQCLRSLHSGT